MLAHTCIKPSKYYHGLAGSPIKNIAIPPTANRSSSRSRSLGIRFCLAVGSWLIFRANWMMQWQNLSRAHITVQGFKSSELSSLKTTYLKPDCFAIPTLLWICLPTLFFLIVSPGGPPIEVPAWLGRGHQDSWRWIRQSRIHQGWCFWPAEPQAARSRSEAAACLSTLFPLRL